ncbi:hypothetical protein Bbelb_402700 [Branchiostoma belcheri]|nr:hypothetical protein Bbelb_402700 [Branchiostoma belcheri]
MCDVTASQPGQNRREQQWLALGDGNPMVEGRASPGSAEETSSSAGGSSVVQGWDRGETGSWELRVERGPGRGEDSSEMPVPMERDEFLLGQQTGSPKYLLMIITTKAKAKGRFVVR